MTDYSPHINELCKSIHTRNVEYGFKERQKARNPTEVTMLIISELSEAFEELRKGYDPNYIYYTCGKPEDIAYHEIHPGDYAATAIQYETDNFIRYCSLHEKPVKPEGFGVEFADAMIRLLDAAPEFHFTYDHLIPLKMAYNNTRELKHGKTM